ncbi:MAG: DUF1349 domain-containing protein [Bacteroidales bacterium]|nr:DUF1349 domain-containing protein [Bacteroidales bacterium]
MKKAMTMMLATAMLVACTSNGEENGNMAQNDSLDAVAAILNEGQDLDLSAFEWTREPESFEVKGDTIEIVTKPKTDLWQRTYYHFRNDNAPAFQLSTREKFFSFVVKTNFEESHHRFDQCGVVMYLDSDNWLKGSIEYENEQFQHLGSVATNNGYSDWATTAIPADVKSMWYRLSRREDDFCIECSTDGTEWSQMRVCHMYEAQDEIRFGIYACSPEESSFKAVFTDMKITECMWKAHDGQQPDEE